VWKNKEVEKGEVVRNKSRLVAQGFSRKEGIDYEETFALVARLEAIRILLAFSVAKGFKLHQMDVKSAFLNGVLEEEVYVRQPPGFQSEKYPHRVYKLRKALYADEEGEHVDQKEYRSMIGSLLYLTAMRPDIQFSVCLCARFQASPRTSHRQAVKRIFQVLASHSRLRPLVLRVLFFGASWFFRCGFCRVSAG
jgi:hypothetical protein